jgi:uncharacterized membrane-anchored protein
MPNKMSNIRKKRQLLRKHINPKLRRSLRIYLIVGAAVLIYVIISTIKSGASAIAVILGLIAGAVIGMILSRIYKISWDKDANHVIHRMDVFGIVLLAVFVVFDLNRGHIVQLFVHGDSVGTISLALLAGAFYGRVFGAGRGIVKVLREQKVLSVSKK